MSSRTTICSLPRHLSDPTKAFYQFAAQMRFDKKVKGLSLGQGQGLKATRLIEEATQKGTWVRELYLPLFRGVRPTSKILAGTNRYNIRSGSCIRSHSITTRERCIGNLRVHAPPYGSIDVRSNRCTSNLLLVLITCGVFQLFLSHFRNMINTVKADKSSDLRQYHLSIYPHLVFPTSKYL